MSKRTYKDDAVWVKVDPATLSPAQALAYAKLRDTRKMAQEARAEFERAAAIGIPSGKRMVFGYNFGQLSVAIVAATEEDKRVAAPKAVSLVEYLRQEAAR